MFINHTAHSLTDSQHAEACRLYGEIVEMPSPSQIDPMGSTEEIRELALQNAKKILAVAPADQLVVMVMGEFSYSYHVAKILLGEGAMVVVATTKREAIEEKLPDGSVRKTNIFKHVQFRAL